MISDRLRWINDGHPKVKMLPDLAWEFGWTRRARGEWRWNGGVDAALVEQSESYLVGCGPADAPLTTWTCGQPSFRISHGERAALVAQYGSTWLWVRQIGTHALSPPLPLAHLT